MFINGYYMVIYVFLLFSSGLGPFCCSHEVLNNSMFQL